MEPGTEPRIIASTLELMLLAMVQRGLPTSYELLTKAGLSVGASSRALKRLESDGLLKSTSGPRTSQRFALTQKGETYLKRTWASVAKKASPVTYESALRFLYLAWLFNEPSVAISYAKKAVEELRYRAKRHEIEADDIRNRFAHLWDPASLSESELSVAVLGAVYRWLKTSTDADVTRAQADSLEKAAAEIHRLTPITKLRAEVSQKTMF